MTKTEKLIQRITRNWTKDEVFAALRKQFLDFELMSREAPAGALRVVMNEEGLTVTRDYENDVKGPVFAVDLGGGKADA